MHWHDDWWGHHMGGMMWIWVLLTFLAIAAIVFLIARATGAGGAPKKGSAGDDPEEILKRRYARGEIDEDELHRRMDALRGS